MTVKTQWKGDSMKAPSSRVDDVMTWYDAIAPSYDELYGDEQLRKYDHIFAVLQAPGNIPCREDLVVIDVGCGTSLIAEELSRLLTTRTYYYVGIDLSLNILEIAKRRVSKLDVVTDLVAGDATSLPFRSEIADIIFSISVFRCEDPVNNLVQEAMRLCRGSGIMAFTVVCGEGVERTACYGTSNPFYESVIRSGRELIRIIKCQQPKNNTGLRKEP